MTRATPEQGLRLFETMVTIRHFEQAAIEHNLAGRIRGAVHPYIGQEAIAAGICAPLRTTDYVASYHRGHGHTIAKGADPVAMMAELFGRSTGTCAGKAGSLHIADISVGMLGANGVVGDGVTMSVGAAQAARLLGNDAVAVPFFGDGAMNRGPVLEAMNWAKAFNLPVLFVCEDNRYSYTQRTDAVTGGPGPTARAAGFGLHAETIDGNDVIAVFEAAMRLVEAMRSGSGPVFIHALTYRTFGHIARDTGGYRPPGEVARHEPLDPIGRCEGWLLDRDVPPAAISEVRERAAELIARAVSEAADAPWPQPQEAFTDSQDLGAPTWPA